MEKISFTDHTQRIRYPAELSAQKEALENSEILALYRRNRAKLLGSRWCPRYHLVAPAGFLHDPNGLCFWQGRWHLFYQHYYDESSAVGLPEKKSTVCWGHAVSSDLVSWQDLPDAIYPNPEQACWSGAILVEQERAIAVYFAPGAGIMAAVSSDPLLLNWEKLGKGKAVISSQDEEGNPAPCPLYDPCLFREGEYYYLLSGISEKKAFTGRGHRQEFLFRSRDLERWEYRQPLLGGDDLYGKGNDGSCPYLLPIGEGESRRHLLIHFSHSNGPLYALGELDMEQERFRIVENGKFSTGGFRLGGVHAPSAHPDGKGGAVVLFNMNNTIPEGYPIMSLPQIMRLTGPLRDVVEFDVAEGVKSLRGEHVQTKPRTLRAGELYIPREISGDCMELCLEADILLQRVLELFVLCSPEGEEYTKISVYRNSGTIDQDHVTTFEEADKSLKTVVAVDSSHTSANVLTPVRAPEYCETFIEKDEPVRLRVFLDRGMLEVFVNGKASLVQRVYPGREDSLGVALRAVGGDAEIKLLEKWTMKTIYQEQVNEK